MSSRSSRRAPRDKDDDRWRRSSRRSEDDSEDDHQRKHRRGKEKPGKVQAIGIMVLVGGILALLAGVALATTRYGLFWPGTYYSAVVGSLSILRGSQLLGEKAHRSPPPNGIGVMMLINIINVDFINLILGTIVLEFLRDPEVKRYFRG